MKKMFQGKNIVVIGSGIGGMSAGILMMLLGYHVTVVEKNSHAGGVMRSYKRSGVDCPVGVHYVGALGAEEPLGKMFRVLGISVGDIFARMGQDGVIDHYIFDNFSFDLPADMDSYEKNLLNLFPAEDSAIRAIIRNMRTVGRSMLDNSFLLNQIDPFQNIDFLHPLTDYLNKMNVSDDLQSVLAVPAQLIGVPASQCPVIFHHMVLAGYLFSCWRPKESGSKMADIFMQRFTALGGKIILGNGVHKVSVQGGRVTGVELESGSFLPADAVLAAIHPKVLLSLLEAENLKDSYRQRVSGLKETEGVVVVHAAVDAGLHRHMNYNIYRLHAAGKGLFRNGVFYQLQRCRADSVNLLSIITQSLYQEWDRWENTRSGKRDREYEEKKLEIAHNLLREAGEIFGDLADAKILDVFTPLTLRDYVNSPEGSCYGVMRSSSQLLKTAVVNNIPLPGLYLAGQNVVAPGVLGSMLGSFNAVRQIVGTERLAEELAARLRHTP